MGMTGTTSPFGQPFSQTGGQQMGATGVNPQLASKQSMVNSLPAFPTDIKNTSVTTVPNMVSCLLFSVLRGLVGCFGIWIYGAHSEKL
jgi:hypothetical protein